MDAIEHLRKADKRLSKVIDKIGTLEYHSYNDSDDGFVFLVREIIGQMISAKVKKVIYKRLVDLCRDNIVSPNNLLTLSLDDLRGIGLSRSKSEYLLNLASLVNEGGLHFASIAKMPDEYVIERLTSIRGIGNWTAKMYLIFFLQRENVLPYEDGAFLQSYRWLYETSRVDKTSISKKCRKWQPYTSIGARYLYKALDMGLTKQPIKQFLK